MATDEAAEILAILRAVNEPRKSTLRQAALTTRLLGRTSADLAALNANPTEQDRLLNEFIAWEGHWQTRGLVSLLAKIDVDESITDRLASNDQGERRITNLRHIVEILSGFAAESGSKPNELYGGTEVEVRHIIDGHEKGVNWVTFHPTMKILASAADDKNIKLWRLSGNKHWEMETLKGHSNNISCVIFHPRMEILLSNSEDRTMRFWDMNRRV